MTRRRAVEVGILTKIGNYSFWATDITEYLRSCGEMEIDRQMANYESSRTTGLHDLRDDRVSLDKSKHFLI